MKTKIDLLAIVGILTLTLGGCTPRTIVMVVTPTPVRTESSATVSTPKPPVGTVPTPKILKPVLAIGGKVSRDIYMGGLGGTSASASSIQYVVELVVENIGESSVEFDQINVRFIAGNTTKGLNVTSRKTDGTVYLLKPKEITEHEFDTDGYTMDLLRDGGGKVTFRIEFVRAGKTVAGPYYAGLPTLDKLGDGKKIELQFSTIKPSGLSSV